jgi:hypothetical protein
LSTEATPPGGVAQAAELRPGGVEQGIDRRPQRARVGLDLRGELELAAREHDRRPVLADRAGDEDAVAGAQALRRQRRPRVAPADAGGAQEHPVGVAALDDLGVAGDDLDAGRARRRGDGVHLHAQRVGVEPLLEDHRQAQRERARAGDGEVVDGAVDREVADRPAGEAQRLHDERVGGDHQVVADRARVGHRRAGLGAEGGDEQPLDQRLRRLAAGAVGHRDRGVLELRALGADGLDDVEDLALALGDGVGGHTTSRSLAKRPKL